VQTVYLVSVWLHILAATTWAGGMLFLVLVVVPWLRSGRREQAALFLRETGERFRTVGWTCFAILIATGAFNLSARGVRLNDLVDAQFYASGFGRALAWKLGLVAVVMVISAVHDFNLGPRATVAIEKDPASSESLRLRRAASLFGRANLLLALLIFALGVVLVRGWP
jgi:putative copper resistance protein D